MDNANLILCTTIGVDCVPNDPVSISYGDPEFLGFDFDVRKDEVFEMMDYISHTLNNLDVPVLNIYSYGNIALEEKRIWTKERMLASMEKEADYLREEADKAYSKGRSR